jgi:hypothetical protein
MNVTMNVVNADRTHAGMSSPFYGEWFVYVAKLRQARTQSSVKGGPALTGLPVNGAGQAFVVSLFDVPRYGPCA